MVKAMAMGHLALMMSDGSTAVFSSYSGSILTIATREVTVAGFIEETGLPKG